MSKRSFRHTTGDVTDARHRSSFQCAALPIRRVDGDQLTLRGLAAALLTEIAGPEADADKWISAGTHTKW